MTTPQRLRPPFRPLLALAVAALLLAAAIGLARVDADFGTPTGPERLLQAIDAGQVPAADILPRADDILRTRPIDGRAFRVLARIADTHHEPARATSLYVIAVQRAPRDRATRAALADRAFAAGDADAGFAHLDALFRVAPGLAEPLLVALMPSLHDARLETALIARMAGNPPWRGAVARAARDPSVGPALALDLMTRLAARTPLTPAEQDARIALLQNAGRDAEARRLWLASLPVSLRPGNERLFDGSFEHTEVEGAYAWQQSPSPGVDIGVDARAADGAQSLALVFGGRAVGAPGLQQALALPPGAYRLRVSVDNGTDAARPFAWRIACSGGAEILSLPLPSPRMSVWQQAAGDFVVPEDCHGQTLRLDLLARSMVERQLSGTLRLDAMQIDAR